jgi:hypothetical protein
MALRRSANRARCQFEKCEKFAQTRGLCKAHGGGSRCRDPDCTKLAQSRGLCIAHGGGRRCQMEGCHKLAQSKGFCISHGGGRRCSVLNCQKFSQVKGRCKSHSKMLLAENNNQGSSSPVKQEQEQILPRRESPKILSPTTYAPQSKRFSMEYLIQASSSKQTLPSFPRDSFEHERASNQPYSRMPHLTPELPSLRRTIFRDQKFPLHPKAMMMNLKVKKTMEEFHAGVSLLSFLHHSPTPAKVINTSEPQVFKLPSLTLRPLA